MSGITQDLLNGNVGNQPLTAYPWKNYADSLINWALEREETHRGFAFDILMSLAYIDSISDLARHLVYYPSFKSPYKLHLGFINLCTPLYIQQNIWCYQKAAKPRSGMIGKLSSEVMIRFIEILFPNLRKVRILGGTGAADALLIHEDGRVILCEVKASPLTTYSLLFSLPSLGKIDALEQLTRTQIEQLNTALYLYDDTLIPLGKIQEKLWPFARAISFITNPKHNKTVERYVKIWQDIRCAYRDKNRESKYYYVANASGHPPKLAREQFDWPAKESISDSKTSVGMDRTDDIKKGIYQTLKLGIEAKRNFRQYTIKTALVSNLPAYRHSQVYVEPFTDILWGLESAFSYEPDSKEYRCFEVSLTHPFDYILTLEDSINRGEPL